ncbi:MAG: hypothetical protein V1767_06050 [Chloroflexota bacterium]
MADVYRHGRAILYGGRDQLTIELLKKEQKKYFEEVDEMWSKKFGGIEGKRVEK